MIWRKLKRRIAKPLRDHIRVTPEAMDFMVRVERDVRHELREATLDRALSKSTDTATSDDVSFIASKVLTDLANKYQEPP